jgi:hypothetical protein
VRAWVGCWFDRSFVGMRWVDLTARRPWTRCCGTTRPTTFGNRQPSLATAFQCRLCARWRARASAVTLQLCRVSTGYGAGRAGGRAGGPVLSSRAFLRRTSRAPPQRSTPPLAQVARMTRTRTGCAATVLRDRIVVCGGWDGVQACFGPLPSAQPPRSARHAGLDACWCRVSGFRSGASTCHPLALSACIAGSRQLRAVPPRAEHVAASRAAQHVRVSASAVGRCSAPA